MPSYDQGVNTLGLLKATLKLLVEKEIITQEEADKLIEENSKVYPGGMKVGMEVSG
jgi:hypothetical protein